MSSLNRNAMEASILDTIKSLEKKKGPRAEVDLVIESLNMALDKLSQACDTLDQLNSECLTDENELHELRIGISE